MNAGKPTDKFDTNAQTGAYRKLTQQDISYLRSITAQDRVFSGSGISEDYFHDELGGIHREPDALVRVKTTEEIASLLQYANEKHIPVTVRGSGTGLVGGAVALYGGILLDTTLMNAIIELDEDNLTLTVEPGVLLMELAAFAESRGFLYPPDPGEKSATIAGNISTNAGGMRAVKYGVTRDYVRGLTVVLSSGEILELGGKTVKNSSGYSLKDLIIGSEGTLAVITRAVLKLIPLPPVSISLLVPFNTMEEAIDSVPKIVTSKMTPTAIEYFSRQTVLFAEDYLGKKFPDTKSHSYILLTFDGSSATYVQEQLTQAAELCIKNGATDAYIVDTEERKKSVWSARGAFLEAIKSSTTEMDECDVVVPRSRVAEFIIFTQNLSKKLNIRIPGFGHAGDGNLHLYLCRDSLAETEWKRVTEAVFESMYKKAAELGGQVSGEHGIGWAKKEFLANQLGNPQIQLMRGLKAVFDPNNILNPGKLCE